VKAILHFNHLEVCIDAKLSQSIGVEIELILVDSFEMFFDEIEVFESKSNVVLTQVAETTLTLIPHAL